MSVPKQREQRRRLRGGGPARSVTRACDYRNLRNPFAPATVFSEDAVAAIHESALQVLEELGIKVLLPEARQVYARGGAIVDEGSHIVRIGRDIIDAALKSAPRSIELIAGARHRDVTLEMGCLTFQSGAGSPYVNDLVRGRRAATLRDYQELTKLTQHFDVLHMLNPLVEPQDIPLHLRHYHVTQAQLTLSDKFPFVFSRGTPQVVDCFRMIQEFRGLSAEEFEAAPHCYTIINTNSPRQLDVPMAQGLIDFARAGQMSIVTPFCLMGAMAPVTVAGALTLSHAEALAAIALTQLVRAGAPVCYGAFVSNVDMKSGAPAFGTPEEVKANLGAGQLARLLGLPWRCAAGSASNVNDSQAANETQMSAWGAVLAGATVIIHGAGWLEGGLTVSFEKIITDLEVLQTFAELCVPTPAEKADIALDALREVPPGGHFFGAAHTMERYQTAFYQPLVADWSNFGTWMERGSKSASERATAIWQSIVNDDPTIAISTERCDVLHEFIRQRTREGGAPPES